MSDVEAMNLRELIDKCIENYKDKDFILEYDGKNKWMAGMGGGPHVSIQEGGGDFITNWCDSPEEACSVLLGMIQAKAA